MGRMGPGAVSLVRMGCGVTTVLRGATVFTAREMCVTPSADTVNVSPASMAPSVKRLVPLECSAQVRHLIYFADSKTNQ